MGGWGVGGSGRKTSRANIHNKQDNNNLILITILPADQATLNKHFVNSLIRGSNDPKEVGTIITPI